MSSRSRAVAAVVVVACSAQVAAAKDIVIETPGERTSQQKALVGGLAGAGVLLGALGVYFHLDSRDASDEVTADGFTGRSWTPDKQDAVDRAERSRTLAAVGYGVGGALLIGAVISLIVTEPKSEITVIRPRAAVPTVSPTQGGAVFGGTWSF